MGFAYDEADRISQITNGINGALTQSFGYGALSRLTSVASTASNESYQYDVVHSDQEVGCKRPPTPPATRTANPLG